MDISLLALLRFHFIFFIATCHMVPPDQVIPHISHVQDTVCAGHLSNIPFKGAVARIHLLADPKEKES